MKRTGRRVLSVALVLFLCISIAVSASATSFSFNDGTGYKTMTVALSGSRSRSIIISQIPAMEHYQGVSETTGTSGTVSIGILADPVYEGTYEFYLEQTMRDAGVKTSHTHNVYGGLYYTFDSGLESGTYRVAAVFHGKYGSWKVTSGTSNNGATLESGTITYAPTGSVSYAPYKVA